MRYVSTGIWLFLACASLYAQPLTGLPGRQASYGLLDSITRSNVLLDRAYGKISPLRGFSDRKTSFEEWVKIFSIIQFGSKEDSFFTFSWLAQVGNLQTPHQLPDLVGDPARMDTPSDLFFYLDHVQASPLIRARAVEALVTTFGVQNRERLPEFQLVPVGIIYEPYEWLSNKAKKYLQFTGDSLSWVPGLPPPPPGELLNNDTVFVVHPLATELVSDTVVYYIDPRLDFTTTSRAAFFDHFQMDFGDGKGYQAVKPGTCHAVVYPMRRSQVHTRASYTGYNPQATRAVLPAFRDNITPLPPPNKPGKPDPVVCADSASLYPHDHNTTKKLVRRMSASLQFDTTGITGHTCQAEMRMLYAHTDQKLRRPFIIVTGYNPFPKSFSAFVKDYNSLESSVSSGLLTRLIEQGYDICIFKPVSGVDYIENNARLMQQALHFINGEKAKNLPAGCMDSCGYENVVIGWSAGGLTAKLCLASMEHNHIPHHTRLYLSWDGEHKGANIPLGVQHSLGYLADYTGPVLRHMISALNDHRLLNSPCAQELLALHFTQTGTPAAPAIGCSPVRTSFLAALEKVGGYPSICKAALAAGGSKGAPFTAPYYHFKDKQALFDGSSKRRKRSMEISYHAAPSPAVFSASQDGKIQQQYAADTTHYPAWDNCPGSSFGKTGFMGIINPATGIYTRFQPGCAHITKATNPDCFVPVISALDIKTDDPYYNPSVTTPGSTPFDFYTWGTCQDKHDNGKMVEKAATFILDRVNETGTCQCKSPKP